MMITPTKRIALGRWQVHTESIALNNEVAKKCVTDSKKTISSFLKSLEIRNNSRPYEEFIFAILQDQQTQCTQKKKTTSK
uniref:Uncharacterized protein n=1 Tax=Parascaris equorum TaxID=6256 RepID=A0A914R639_PAREQ